MIREATTQLKNSLTGLGLRQTDPVSFALARLEYVKAAAAVFSILTLHVLFFCLNVDFLLWPLIDFSFLANITFTFGLIVALAFYSVRVVPFFATMLSSLILAMWIGALTLIRYRRSRSQFAQRSPIHEAADRVFGKRGKWGLSLVAIYALIPFPSRAGMRVINRKQQVFLDKHLGKTSFLGYLAAILVVCFFYTGFAILYYIFCVMYLFVLFLGSSNLKGASPIDAFVQLISGRSIDEKVEGFLKLDDRTRRNVISGILIAFGALSAAAGDLRFEYLLKSNPVTVKQQAGESLSLIQFASNSKGVFFNVRWSEQVFIPYGAIKSIKTFD